MSISLSFYLQVIKNLLRADFIDFKSAFFHKCIDLSIWIGINLCVTGYLMTAQFGIAADFGVFMLAGCLASAGLVETYPRVFTIVNDFESEQSIFYYLTLPIPPQFIILKTIIFYTLSSSLMALPILPLGKLILWDSFDLGKIAVLPLILIFLLSNLFYAVTAFVCASFIPNVGQMERLWTRIIFPLWFLGGFQFSWYALYSVAPKLGYFALLNPITYIMAGTRTALNGNPEVIPFWVCVVAILLFTMFGYLVAVKRLKRRLDFV